MMMAMVAMVEVVTVGVEAVQCDDDDQNSGKHYAPSIIKACLLSMGTLASVSHSRKSLMLPE